MVEKSGVRSGRQAAPEDFGEFRTALHGQFESLSPHLKRIAEYALGEPVRFALQTAAEAARQVNVQPSTLVRFAKLFGFSGFSELQQLIRRRLIDGDLSFDARLHPRRQAQDGEGGDEEAAILDGCAAAAIRAVRRLQSSLDADALGAAVDLLSKARTVSLYGHGRGFVPAACLAHGLMERRYRCSLLDAVPGTAESDVLGMDAEDLLVAFAPADVPQPLMDSFSAASARGVPIVCIADSEFGALSRVADVYLAVPSSDEQVLAALVAHMVLAQTLVSAAPPKCP